MKKRICLLLAALLLGGAGCVYSQQRMEMPVETVKRIGDKLIRETPFAYKLD